MRNKLIALSTLSVLLFSVAAVGQQTSKSKGVTTTQNLTGSAPTLATDGVSLANAAGYTVIVSAAAGQTVTGGSLLCYYYGCVSWVSTSSACSTYRWMRCPTSLDFTPATGARDASSGDYQVLTGIGRVFYMPSAVTVSSGTTVGVTVIARERL